MNLPERDELLMAYLDGEMSAAEAASFSAALTDAERGRAEAETRLESALAKRLALGPACPEETWGGVLKQLDAARPARPWWNLSRPLRIAAALLLATGAWGVTGYMYRAQILRALSVQPASPYVMTAQTIEDLTAHALVGGSPEEIQRFLDKEQIGVRLVQEWEQSPHGRRIDLKGAGLEQYGDIGMPAIYFECCGQPAKIYFVHNCHAEPERCARYGLTDICDSKQIGQFTAIVVAKHHHAGRALGLFGPKARSASNDRSVSGSRG